MNLEWSENENQIIVSSYLDMLDKELKKQKYDKSAVKEVLLQKLPNRNSASIDYKLRNISSVLEDSGFPYINGYKPAKHYQASLKEVVSTLIFRRAFSITNRK